MSVDHIVPRSVVPELDNVIANLEVLPRGTNASLAGVRELHEGLDLGFE